MERAFAIISGDERTRVGHARGTPLEELLVRRGLDRAGERAELALDIAEAQVYPAVLALALRAKAAVVFSRGHFEESRALLGRALDIAVDHELLEDKHLLLPAFGRILPA